jgi:Fe2+ or Zn2+ uptake regulation protein
MHSATDGRSSCQLAGAHLESVRLAVLELLDDDLVLTAEDVSGEAERGPCSRVDGAHVYRVLLYWTAAGIGWRVPTKRDLPSYK